MDEELREIPAEERMSNVEFDRAYDLADFGPQNEMQPEVFIYSVSRVTPGYWQVLAPEIPETPPVSENDMLS